MQLSKKRCAYINYCILILRSLAAVVFASEDAADVVGYREVAFLRNGVRMLVLTRRPGQSVYIGDDVKITLVEIKGNQVRIGVDAPPNVRIFREEIYLQILEENRSAAALSAESSLPGAGVIDQTKEILRGESINQFRVERKRPVRKKDGQEGQE